jgi:hypothetical protein
MDDFQTKQIKLLSVFHYIVGIIVLLFSMFPLIHIYLGYRMLKNPALISNGEPAHHSGLAA